MAKKKKQAVKKSDKTTVAAGKVRTKIMSAFIRQFVGSKANPWPAKGQTNASISADFETFMDVLISAAVTLTSPTSGGSGFPPHPQAELLRPKKQSGPRAPPNKRAEKPPP